MQAEIAFPEAIAMADGGGLQFNDLTALGPLRTKRLFECRPPVSWKALVLFYGILAVVAFALAGCNTNQAINPSGQADLSRIYYNYSQYNPIEYGQTSGFYGGR